MNTRDLNTLLETASDFTHPREETMAGVRTALTFLSGRTVYIYGAGWGGRRILSLLRAAGIDVAGFFDKRADRIPAVEGLPLLPPQAVLARCGPDAVLISGTNTLRIAEDIQRSLDGLGGAIEAINGALLGRLLSFPMCRKRRDEGHRFSMIECAQCGYEWRRCALFYGYLQDLNPPLPASSSGCTDFDLVGYTLSQICSLRCVNCCESVPFQAKGKGFVPMEEVLGDLDRIARACQYLERIEMIGGEPFLHPEFAGIVRGILGLANVGYLTIFTNGTVVPSDDLCEAVAHERVLLFISDYSRVLSPAQITRFETTRRKLEAAGVNLQVIGNDVWCDFSSYEECRSDPDVLHRAFINCFLADCHRLHRGVLYRCPHQYGGMLLGTLPVVAGEIVDLHATSDAELPDALRRFEALPYLEACRHCTMPFDAPEIPAGLQLGEDGEPN